MRTAGSLPQSITFPNEFVQIGGLTSL